MVGITGVANTLAGPLFRLWQVDQLATMIRPWHDKPVPDHIVSVGAAVEAAQRALPKMQPESLAYPYSRFESPHHYIVWFKGTTVLTSRLETPVLVDSATVRICRMSRSLSEAGRILFAALRTRRTSANDADRLRKYLARFDLDWSSVTST